MQTTLRLAAFVAAFLICSCNAPSVADTAEPDTTRDLHSVEDSARQIIDRANQNLNDSALPNKDSTQP